ncbi:hypothetical protein [Marinobacter salarius]|uniref:Uncharacterized protein n=1 Tax=Marinobacter salarius TaxID=1420917 RepID=A0A1W6KFV2_9GAMM|nr:hypothetical protein [Marinobacter salarius]ARM86306.1 hypothetical protein MARSALSMR5_04289 [Marinobacter salarius]
MPEQPTLTLSQFIHACRRDHFSNLSDSHLAIRASECGAFGDVLIFPGDQVAGVNPRSNHYWVRVADFEASGAFEYVAEKLYSYAVSRGVLKPAPVPGLSLVRSMTMTPSQMPRQA